MVLWNWLTFVTPSNNALIHDTSWQSLARPTQFTERLLQLAVRASSKFHLHCSSTLDRVVLFKRAGNDLVH
jgi:hypothetical protein